MNPQLVVWTRCYTAFCNARLKFALNSSDEAWINWISNYPRSIFFVFFQCDWLALFCWALQIRGLRSATLKHSEDNCGIRSRTLTNSSDHSTSCSYKAVLILSMAGGIRRKQTPTCFTDSDNLEQSEFSWRCRDCVLKTQLIIFWFQYVKSNETYKNIFIQIKWPKTTNHKKSKPVMSSLIVNLAKHTGSVSGQRLIDSVNKVANATLRNYATDYSTFQSFIKFDRIK